MDEQGTKRVELSLSIGSLSITVAGDEAELLGADGKVADTTAGRMVQRVIDAVVQGVQARSAPASAEKPAGTAAKGKQPA